MEYTQSRSFLMKIQTSDNNILDPWNSLIDMLNLSSTGSVSEWLRSSEEAPPSLYTVTMTLHGSSDIMVKISGEHLRPSLAKKALIVVLWEMFPSFLRESNRFIPHRLLIQRSMEEAIHWSELKQKE